MSMKIDVGTVNALTLREWRLLHGVKPGNQLRNIGMAGRKS
jgi:hypothetical protein